MCRNCHPLESLAAFYSVFLCLLPRSQGDGHFFPMRALCEAQNPLLANEEQWEDDGIDEEPHGKVPLKEITCVLTYSDYKMNYKS